MGLLVHYVGNILRIPKMTVRLIRMAILWLAMIVMKKAVAIKKPWFQHFKLFFNKECCGGIGRRIRAEGNI